MSTKVSTLPNSAKFLVINEYEHLSDLEVADFTHGNPESDLSDLTSAPSSAFRKPVHHQASDLNHTTNRQAGTREESVHSRVSTPCSPERRNLAQSQTVDLRPVSWCDLSTTTPSRLSSYLVVRVGSSFRILPFAPQGETQAGEACEPVLVQRH